MAEQRPPLSAELLWDENGQPLSANFGDVYFSRDDGLQESRFVFLQQNRLAERFAALADNAVFVIGETGFGTGLNFLVTCQLWQQTAPASAQLQFISVEKHPLTPADLKLATQLWPELQRYSQQLLELYPALLHRGFHRLNLADSRIRLTLIIDDAYAGLAQLLQSTHPAFCQPRRSVDAWFLDGFAPAKNPDMWQPRLFSLIQQLSAAGTTLATFTCAGVVKRGLAEAGFAISRIPGYGRKREMLRADLRQPPQLPPADSFTHSARPSTHPVPWHIHVNPAIKGRRALIVGGGIAGCHLARRLAERHWQVELLEQHPQLGAGGSGNPQAAVYAKLSHRAETLSDFNLQALLFALRAYRPFWRQAAADPVQGSDCGLLQLASDAKTASSYDQLHRIFAEQQLCRLVDAAEAAAISGLPLACGGLYLPASGWLAPPALCRWLVKHPAIRICKERRMIAAQPHHNGGWTLTTSTAEELQADVLVLCTANAIREFEATRQLPVKPVRGQISYLRATPLSQQLRTVICGDGYITPALGRTHCIGASFNPQRLDTDLSEAEHRQNIELLDRQIPGLQEDATALQVLGGRAALRCTTPDYLPMVGPAPNYQAYLETYQLLRNNARSSIPRPGPIWDNLYLSVGYGSRGLAYTPLCAEILAARINNEPAPVSVDLETALHPARFWIRDLGRGKI